MKNNDICFGHFAILPHPSKRNKLLHNTFLKLMLLIKFQHKPWMILYNWKPSWMRKFILTTASPLKIDPGAKNWSLWFPSYKSEPKKFWLFQFLKITRMSILESKATKLSWVEIMPSFFEQTRNYDAASLKKPLQLDW